MTSLAQSRSVRTIANAAAAPRDAPPAGPLTAEGFDSAYGEISAWPRYAPTRLVPLPALARRLGLGALFYKDEGDRFGLGSFKPLGGAYAVARALARELARKGIEGVTIADLMAGRHKDKVAGITLVSATDGNHGRSVAWGARLCGAKARIFSHDQMSEARRIAIRDLGAELVICPGGYDDSVREAFRVAGANGWPVVQDTAIGDYRQVPIDICHGYGVIAEEVIRAGLPPFTHVIVQAGVGGVAAAILTRFWQAFGAERPRFIVLEPETAACVTASLEAGSQTALTGDTHTAMAGLACGEVSDIAWEALATGADGAIVIGDGWAFEGMRRLADPQDGDPPIVAGECGGGAVGALIALAERPGLAAPLGLDATSRVLLIGTEGATDPAIYAEVVGRTPDMVLGR
ncbi:MAG: diaminopropionate ammonia-lyase [Acuticoccus sp.]